MMQPDLLKIRGELDKIDAEIVRLFDDRMKLCRDVAQFKINTGKPVFDKEREKQKIDAVRNMAETDFDKKAVEELFTQIMTISRRYQYQLLEHNGRPMDMDFEPVSGLPLKDIRVVYPGVEGAYSHAAALGYFGEDADTFHVPLFEDAMKAVQEGLADYAVIPIENSSAGAVIDTYDLLNQYDNIIAAETFVTVSHALLGLPQAKPEDIKTVYSHPQGLMQSSVYLNSHREWRQISVENTAIAAKKVLDDQDITQAAVASETAGRIYGLKVLEKSINYNKQNTTRFVILAKRKMYCRDASKVSICFELPHQSGSLYNMLGHIIYNGINMVMIESRPIPGRNWEYRFFVDMEGNLSDDGIRNALKGISEEASSMRILGNY